jgi:hypothetical protein
VTADKMSTAVKEMEALFRAKWTAPRLCDYPNQNFELPAKSAVWARWRCQHATGAQGSLSNVLGKRRFNRGGTLFIQVFTPLNASELASYDETEIVVGAYEGKTTPSGVWFRNVRIQEINQGVQTGASDGNVTLWEQKNVLVDFIYDQIH